MSCRWIKPRFCRHFRVPNCKTCPSGKTFMWSWNGFYFPENNRKQRLGVTRSWTIEHTIFLFSLLNWNQLAVEVTQCRDCEWHWNENITRMSLPFNLDPVYFGELLTPRAMTERHGEDSIYRWKSTNKWLSSMSLMIADFLCYRETRESVKRNH